MSAHNLTISDPFGRQLGRLCRIVALAGGALLLVIMLFVSSNVISGAVFSSPLLGDTELVELVGAVAVFAFLPYCHFVGANVKVEVIERYLPPRIIAFLDFVGNALFLIVSVILFWRLVVGGLEALANSDITMFLQIPVAAGYFGAIIPSALWVAVALYVVISQVRTLSQIGNPDQKQISGE